MHQDWERYLQGADASAGSGAAGIAYLPELAAVRFSGSDVRKFLQGYLTCDTDDLGAGRLTPTALCNLKGRVVMNGWCVPLPEDSEGAQAIALILHQSLVERLQSFLEAYLKFSRSALTDLRDSVLVFGTLDAAGTDAADEPDGALIMDPRRRLDLVSTLDQAITLWDGHSHIDAATWHASLTADRIPLVSTAVSETFLPQMLDLQALGAINFEKGCYLGQEVVARAQHRGQVKRRLARLGWRGSAHPVPGAEINDRAGRTQGVVVQTATDGSGLLLAVLSRDAPGDLRQGDVDLSLDP